VDIPEIVSGNMADRILDQCYSCGREWRRGSAGLIGSIKANTEILAFGQNDGFKFLGRDGEMLVQPRVGMVVSTPVRMPVGQRAVTGLEVSVEADAFGAGTA